MKRFKIMICACFFMLCGVSSLFAEDPIYTRFYNNTAVGGFDTVAYFVDGKAVEGNSEYQMNWMGADWYFVSEAHLKLFRNNPEKYAPQYGGYCSWAVAHGELVSSDPEQWFIEKGKLYLNYNKSVKEKWLPLRAELIPLADEKFETLIED